MAAALREVHIYIEAENDVAHVVPVTHLASGLWVEALPVQVCQLTGERASMAQQLAPAIEQAALRSEQLMGQQQVQRWGGKGQHLWEHNRLFVALEWHPDRVVVIERRPGPVENYPLPQWQDGSKQRLSPDASGETIARAVLHYLP